MCIRDRGKRGEAGREGGEPPHFYNEVYAYDHDVSAFIKIPSKTVFRRYNPVIKTHVLY